MVLAFTAIAGAAVTAAIGGGARGGGGGGYRGGRSNDEDLEKKTYRAGIPGFFALKPILDA